MTIPLLTIPRLPARLGVEQAALLLGFTAREIHILVKARLLKPLGHPVPEGMAWFSTAVLEAFAKDPVWLDRATKTMEAHLRTNPTPDNVIAFPDTTTVSGASVEGA